MGNFERPLENEHYQAIELNALFGFGALVFKFSQSAITP